MKPIRMIASNFLSFKDFDYEFEDRVVTLVGENLTEEDQGSNGSGKALSLDSDIMTITGSIKMRDIKIGDKILGFNGKEQSVVATAPQGIIDCYRITFNDGTEVECNDEHLWKVASCYTPQNWKVVNLKDIMKQSIRCDCGTSKPYRYRIPTVEKIEYNHKDILIDPYVLGCLLGDGTLGCKIKGYSKSYYSQSRTILFTSKDDEILNRFQDKLPQGLYLKKQNNCNYRIQGSKDNDCDSMMTLLKTYNLYLQDSETKFIPKDYIFNDREIRLELLRGILDTDGYVDKKGLIELALISKQLIEDVAFVARSLGCLCHKITKMKSGYKKDGQYIECKDHYRLRIVPPKGLNLFHLSRKKERSLQGKKMNCINRRIVSIEYVGKKEMQCIEVSNKDGLFLTNNFVVTHNSSIQQIFYYSLIGSSLRGSSDKKLIRRGEKEARTHIEIWCPMRNETLYIDRVLPLKSSSKLTIKINDKDVSYATVKDGNDFILKWIGISAEDLRNYFIICKEYYKSFFKASNTDRLALISRFINFNKLDGVKDIISKEITKLNAEKRLLENDIYSLQGKLEVQMQNIDKETSRDFEKEKEIRISALEKEINEKYDIIDSWEKKRNFLEEQNSKLDKEIKSSKKMISVTNLELEKIPSIEEEEENLKLIKEELAKTNEGQKILLEKQEIIEAKRGEIRKQLRVILINLSGTITCPKCKYKFLTLKDTTLEEEEKKKKKLGEEEKDCIHSEEEVNKELIEYEEVLTELFGLKSEAEDSINSILDSTRKIKKRISELETIVFEKERIKKSKILEIDSLNQKISEENQKISSLKEKIEEVRETKSEINQSLIDSLNKDISLFQEQIESKQKEVDELSVQVIEKDRWVNRFKDFKMYLAAEQVKNIQNRANKILEKENSDLRLIVEAFKQDSKGNRKDEITPYVIRDEAESFWYYSGGERAKVEVATIIAFQQMINSTNPYGGLEFISFDEVTEGLSKEGLFDMVEALDSMLKFPVLVTTHVLDGSYLEKCKVLRIRKKDGVSKIVSQ